MRRHTEPRGMASIELLLSASLLIGTALLIFGLLRLREAEQNARIDAHFKTFETATDPPFFTFFQSTSHGGVRDRGLSPRQSAPRGFSIGSLPKALAVGEGDRAANPGLQILRVPGARFRRDAVVVRPAWTWRGRIPFLNPNAYTQSFLERGKVRRWYNGAASATLREYERVFKLSKSP